MGVIEDLNWRYATKKFDREKKISSTDLDIILESLRLVPSSYGLQPLKFLVVENQDLRSQLREASYRQNQIVDASHLLVICANVDIDKTAIDDYMRNIQETRKVTSESTAGFSDHLVNSISSMKKEELINWNSKQAYIALGQLLHTCASMRIDAIPMEGFVPKEYDQILGLNSQNLTATLVCPIGYRSDTDEAQFNQKVRKASSDIIKII